MSTATPRLRPDEVASSAERAAGVSVRDADTMADLRAVQQVFDAIWAPDPGSTLVPITVLRANAHAGGHVALAERDGAVVGAAMGFVGLHEGRPHLHSHVAAAAAGHRGRGVGAALKWQQRAWCAARDVQHVHWTFDPLVGRNARFNLTKLGALGTAYLEDFYGQMGDAVNGRDESDRILCTWSLTAARVEAAAHGHVPTDDGMVRGAGRLLADDNGRPRAAAGEGERLLVATPADAERLRREDPALCRLWRHAVRDAIGTALADGWVAVHATRDGDYVLERPGLGGLTDGP